MATTVSPFLSTMSHSARPKPDDAPVTKILSAQDIARFDVDILSQTRRFEDIVVWSRSGAVVEGGPASVSYYKVFHNGALVMFEA